MSSTTTPATEPGHAIFDIEPVLHDMRNATAMLGHMATSDPEVLTELADQIVTLEESVLPIVKRAP